MIGEASPLVLPAAARADAPPERARPRARALVGACGLLAISAVVFSRARGGAGGALAPLGAKLRAVGDGDVWRVTVGAPRGMTDDIGAAETTETYSFDYSYKHDGDGDDDTSGQEAYVERIVGMDTFIASSSVRQFLATRGVYPDEPGTKWALHHYVPRKLIIQYWPDRVEGAIGASAKGGYVAFNIARFNGSSTDTLIIASYNVVMSLDGDDITISATMRENSNHESTVLGGERLHFCGFKLRSPDTFLLAGDNGTIEEGPAFLWNWKTDTYNQLAAGTRLNCHDIQWSTKNQGADGSIWGPMLTANHIGEINVTTGETMKNIEIDDCTDANHVQLVEDDAYAYVSCRKTNSIKKIHIEDGYVEWTLGGTDGDFDLYDLSGNKYEAGHSLWHGQHNAEFFGSNPTESDGGDAQYEIFMFDNEYQQGHSSRLLIVSYDTSSMTAREEWDFDVGAYTAVYGDNDRLPSGNVLGTFWMEYYDVSQWEPEDAKEQFDCRAMEIVRSTKLRAWSVDIQGNKCDNAVCDLTQTGNWRMYSVERFYTAPVVSQVNCYTSDDDEELYLMFHTWNNFKQNNADPGYYELEAKDGDSVTTGNFSFAPHWAPTKMNINIADTSFDTGYNSFGYLLVTNKWGDETKIVFSCKSGHDGR